MKLSVGRSGQRRKPGRWAVEQFHRARRRLVQALVPELEFDVDLRLENPKVHLRRPDSDDPLEFLVRSVEASVAASLQLPAITLALLIPDILGKVQYPLEKNGSKRYAAWYDVQFGASGLLDGYACYALRCKILHEGSLDLSGAHAFKKSRLYGNASRILVTADHGVSIEMGSTDPIVIDGPKFCRRMAAAARSWYVDADQVQRAGVRRLVTDTDVIREAPFDVRGVRFIATRFPGSK